MLDLKNTLTKLDLAAPLSVTASANRTGVDLKDYIGGAIVLLTALNSAGSSPTLDVKLQESADNSTWSDVTAGAFTQVTSAAAANEVIALNCDGAKRYVRVVDTVGGTTPAFTRAVTFFGQKQVI